MRFTRTGVALAAVAALLPAWKAALDGGILDGVVAWGPILLAWAVSTVLGVLVLAWWEGRRAGR
jgi:hypothetical protein